MVSICGGGGPANVHFAEFSLEGRLGGGSPARCSLCSVLASASFNWRLPAEFFFFRSKCVVTGRPRREARRNSVRSTARPSKGRSVCAQEAREIEVPRRLWAKQVHHTAQARAQADTHTAVHLAIWCSCFCCVCPSSEVSRTTHPERPCMLTKRHTTPAQAGADRERAGLHRVHPQPTHEGPGRAKPRLQHAHSRTTPSL